MKIIQIAKGGDLDLFLGGKDVPIKLKEGEKYVLNDVNAVSIAEANKFTKQIQIFDFKQFYRQYKGEPLSGKTLVLYRTGGAGDILFMTPGLRFLKIKYPDCKIIVCTSMAYEGILKNNSDIDEYHFIPTNFKVFEEADYHILFERVIEDNDLAETQNAYELYLHRMGLLQQFRVHNNELSREEKISALLPQVDIDEAGDEYISDLLEEHHIDKDKDLIIGLHCWSTTLLRNYPLDYLAKITQALSKLGVKVLLLGGRGDSDMADLIRNNVVEEYRNNVVNTTFHSYGFEQTISVVDKCDLIVGVDSSLLHIAGGLRVPMIGLFGPFASKFRIGFYFKAVGLEADLRCAPCFIHGPNPCRFSPDKSYSPCMTVLTAELVLGEISKLLVDIGKPSLESLVRAEPSIDEQIEDAADSDIKENLMKSMAEVRDIREAEKH